MTAFRSIRAAMVGDALPSGVPGYWMYETTGVLRPAVEAYLLGQELTTGHIGALRAYFRQWMAAPAWIGPGVDLMRLKVDTLLTRADIDAWLSEALEAGIDPL